MGSEGLWGPWERGQGRGGSHHLFFKSVFFSPFPIPPLGYERVNSMEVKNNYQLVRYPCDSPETKPLLP